MDSASSFSLDQVITIDAQLSSNSEDSSSVEQKSQKCKVTITLHLLAKNTDVSFACEGQPTIEKQFEWNK